MVLHSQWGNYLHFILKVFTKTEKYKTENSRLFYLLFQTETLLSATFFYISNIVKQQISIAAQKTPQSGFIAQIKDKKTIYLINSKNNSQAQTIGPFWRGC